VSDTDVSDSSVLGTTMRGQSRLIVVLGDAQTIKESAKNIKALGNIVRVARGVFLIHGQKDIYFPPEITFELNMKQAGIPDSHTLLLDNAGHGLDNQEVLVLATLVKWMNTHEKMTLINIKTS